MSTTTKEKQAAIYSQQEGDQLEIVYYTDPLCCWSWAMEKHLQQLIDDTAGSVSLRYCMGGLIPDWNGYHDPINAVSKPIQMGPVWMEVRHLTGVPIYDRIWVEDPPASSYPACIAVKSAGLQSAEAEREYLQLVRKAGMLEGKNVAKTAVLLQLGEALQTKFNQQQFNYDLLNGPGKAAFLTDLTEVRTEQIQRFPTLIFKKGGKGVILTGYKTLAALQDAVRKLGEVAAS